ncbi:MAG: hypothetical protein KGH75_00390 [Rhodospirillales bacterium]|nr:hypothetical protein [Rhodospirillales bacterium]
MSVTDVCHAAYGDQIVELIRSAPGISTTQLCSVLGPTPAMTAAIREHVGTRAPYRLTLTPRWLNPYLRMLAVEGRIAPMGPAHTRWTCREPRTELHPSLVDPLTSDELDGGPSNHREGQGG